MAYALLVVDDDKAVRESVVDFLEMLEYEVDSAENAEEAIDKLKQFNADIVITDIMMHGMDGLELTRHIFNEHNANVMVMTGYNADYSYEEAINAGASDFIFKPFRFEELELRIKRVVRELELQKERDQMLKELERLAITDGLTDLFNSRHFFKQVKKEIERHTRYNRPLSLLIIDIDFFKEYNDTFGHLEGDKVLMRIAKVVGECLRTSDTAYRYGGEEFTVILPETELEKACVVGHRIKETIAEQVFTPQKGVERSITVSIGATEYIENESLESFVGRGDKALYMSKNSGRDTLTSL
ncbi:MAG: diguanylate cyclase [Desulfarculaceae bacterium]|nr:diguanylate cyclase [Desulfarculaceae bacterium]